MIFQEVGWIRSGNYKLCPLLRKMSLEWYRPLRYVPCFLQNLFKGLKQKFKKIPVIVEMEKDHASEYSINSTAAVIRCPVDKQLNIINGFSARVNAGQLRRLVENRRIKKIWYDREVHAALDTASKVTGSASLWDKGVTGKGVTAAVIDTGIYDHSDLRKRIIGFKDFVNNKTILYDDNGHGTHVAGNIASSGACSDYKYQGPAPEANIVSVKVLDKTGTGSLSTVIQGIQWCLENRALLKIKIINLSLGSAAVQSYKDDPLCRAVERAWEAGIVVCTAAGNSGPEPGTISSPGIDPFVITVGAFDDKNTVPALDDMVAEFSGCGPTIDKLAKPDIIAPGVNIISLRSPGSFLDKLYKPSRVEGMYASLSGTSMATPICAGVVAQMLEVHPTLTPDEVKTRLLNSADPVKDINICVQGAGRINALKAVQGE